MRTPYQGRKLDELAGLRRFERWTKDGGRLGATEPDLRFATVEQIDVPTLASRGITGVLADLDGTLVGDHQHEVAGSVTAWVDGLRTAGIGVCIVSNSGPARVAPVAAALDVPFVAHAAKPLRRGIDAGLRVLARPANDVALVGDQLFTDVWGGRRSRLLTILVEPRSADQTLLTRLKRPLERLVDGEGGARASRLASVMEPPGRRAYLPASCEWCLHEDDAIACDAAGLTAVSRTSDERRQSGQRHDAVIGGHLDGGCGAGLLSRASVVDRAGDRAVGHGRQDSAKVRDAVS